MKGAVMIVWWAGIAGAFVTTLAILKQASLVIRALHDIRRLSIYTRDAARGIAENVAAGAALAEAQGPAGELREATGKLAAATASVEARLRGLAMGISAAGG